MRNSEKAGERLGREGKRQFNKKFRGKKYLAIGEDMREVDKYQLD
jgi:hypothetical protein